MEAPHPLPPVPAAAVTEMAAAIVAMSLTSGTRIEELLARLTEQVKAQAAQPYTPIALRQAVPPFSVDDGGRRPVGNQEDSAPASDSDASDSGSDDDDSDVNQHVDEREHEHYREMRRSQSTPLGAGPSVLSKFHVGLKTPESCARRAKDLDVEVLSTLARAEEAEREAVTAALLSPSPNTTRVLQVCSCV